LTPVVLFVRSPGTIHYTRKREIFDFLLQMEKCEMDNTKDENSSDTLSGVGR